MALRILGVTQSTVHSKLLHRGPLHCRGRQKLEVVTAMRHPKGSGVEAHTYNLSTAEVDPRTALTLNPARVLQ